MVSLGSIAERLQDGPFGSNLKSAHYVHSGVRVVRLQNIGPGFFVDRDQAFISSDHFQSLSKHECRPGDVMLATLGDPILRAAILPESVGRALNKADCIQLRCDPKVASAEYVKHYLNSSLALTYANAMGHGQTRQRVNLSQLRELPVPLPSIDEQRRIAAVLDAADALRTKRRQALAKLDALTQSIFIDMFGDPVSNPMGWRSDRTLSDVADIRSGITKGRDSRGLAVYEVPFLAVVNVQDGFIVLDPLKSIAATKDEIARYALTDGDILLTEGGDPDKLGRGAVWRSQIEVCIHQNHVFRVRVTDEGIRPDYLSRLLSSARGKRYFLRMAKQTTGIASINMSQLKSFPLLEPPVALQDEFLERARAVAASKALLQRSSDELDDLFASLQQQAFRGEL